MSLVFRNKIIFFVVVLSIFSIGAIFSQDLPHSAHSYLRKGNSEFSKLNYTHSEENYRKGLIDAESSFKLNYNLSNSLYEQKRVEEAEVYYKKAIESARSDERRAKAYHNLGNTYVLMQKYSEAVDSYKSSLRLIPGDMKTKENLFWAQNMKKKQEQEQKKQDQKQNNNEEGENQKDKGEKQENKEGNNEKESEENQKEKDKGEKQENQEKEQDDNKGENKESQDQEEPESGEKEQDVTGKDLEEKKLSKEDVMRLLKVQEGKEQKTREKLFKSRGAKPKSGKDW